MSHTLESNSKDKLSIGGEITFLNANEVYKDGKNAINKLISVELDLSALTKSDSSGLAVVIGLIRQAKRQHKPVVIVNPPSFLLELGRVFGIDTILPIAKTK